MIGFEGVPKLRNLALEPPGLGMSCFVKRSIKKMIGFWGGPKLMNLALEPPGLGMSCFVKRSIKKMMGFWRGAQIQESGPGAARARNELFCYAKY